MVRRVLVIDDDQDIREVIQFSLELVGGWDVLTAESGREGLAKAQLEPVDAIILDMMMPEMNGEVTFKKLKANRVTHNIPVVFLTATIQSAEQPLFAGIGATKIIAKPFDPMILPSQVATALGWNF